MAVINFFKPSHETQFARLLRPHLQRLYTQAYRLTGSQEDAEDLVQDLLIRLYEKQVDLNDIEKPISWLLRSLYNQFIDHYRKKSRLPIDDKESESEYIIDSMCDDAKSPHTLLEQSYTSKSLRDAINTLNSDQQALISLHDIEGYTLTELSEVLDTPVGTLKSRLHRARQSLREQLLQDQPSWEPLPEEKRVIG